MNDCAQVHGLGILLIALNKNIQYRTDARAVPANRYQR